MVQHEGSGAVGVIGGSFDPIHLGHLVTAEQARAALGLDEVVFVPAGDQPQKAHATPAELRYLMTVLATAANPAFSVSRLEVDRAGPTYTVDTLRAMRERRPRVSLYFIAGADAILNIHTWKNPEECLRLAEFVAVTRPGYDLRALESPEVRNRIRTLDVSALAISSSDVRARFGSGRPVRYLIPLEVEQFARKHRLYDSIDVRQ